MSLWKAEKCLFPGPWLLHVEDFAHFSRAPVPLASPSGRPPLSQPFLLPCWWLEFAVKPIIFLNRSLNSTSILPAVPMKTCTRTTSHSLHNVVWSSYFGKLQCNKFILTVLSRSSFSLSKNFWVSLCVRHWARPRGVEMTERSSLLGGVCSREQMSSVVDAALDKLRPLGGGWRESKENLKCWFYGKGNITGQRTCSLPFT